MVLVDQTIPQKNTYSRCRFVGRRNLDVSLYYVMCDVQPRNILGDECLIRLVPGICVVYRNFTSDVRNVIMKKIFNQRHKRLGIILEANTRTSLITPVFPHHGLSLWADLGERQGAKFTEEYLCPSGLVLVKSSRPGLDPGMLKQQDMYIRM